MQNSDHQTISHIETKHYSSRKMRVSLRFILLLGNYIIMIMFVAAYAYAYASPLETYIVHVEPPADAQLSAGDHYDLTDLEKYYLSFMPPPPRERQPGEIPSILFSYQNVFFGFAARLSEEDVEGMETKPGFVSAEKEEIIPLDTTHSPNFLGLRRNTGFWEESNYGRGIIIGIMDTGINPNHPSFGDAGMPIPSVIWGRRCGFSQPRACNNKLIGARSFVGGEPSDGNGHGSHVAGIAAGNFVAGANFNGNALGTASGIAPRAHLAVYKVCNDGGSCPESALIAGIDAAIGDGVNIISLSLGSPSRPFHRSNTAIGAFAAMERGIFVSCSAGNRGPSFGSLSNEAPWVLTVGASTIDRQISSVVRLGNNRSFEGQSAASFHSFSSSSLIYPGLTSSDQNDEYCLHLPSNIQGRIVICRTGGGISRIEKGINVKNGGGRAMILINGKDLGYDTTAEIDVLPTSDVSYADGQEIIAYLRSASSPTATLIFTGTVTGNPHAPRIAWFSSRGPNQESSGILKPDILGPGVEILAASRITGAFSMNSGTSMSCPHLSGVVALLKRTHPTWSPAAIRSAIMTTADVRNRGNHPIEDHNGDPASILAMGSGHVNPFRASNPGLIYDIRPEEYIPFLCGLGYTPVQVQTIVRRNNVDCRVTIPQGQLNYPSFSFVFGQRTQTFTRTLTNVGNPTTTYIPGIVTSGGLRITINPTTLRFTRVNERISYQVTFHLPNNKVFKNESVHAESLTNNNFHLYQGWITWTSTSFDQFFVRTPFAGILYRNAALSNLETVPFSAHYG